MVGFEIEIGFWGGFGFRVWSLGGRGRGLCGRRGGLVFGGSIVFGDLLGFCGGGCRLGRLGCRIVFLGWWFWRGSLGMLSGCGCCGCCGGYGCGVGLGFAEVFGSGLVMEEVEFVTSEWFAVEVWGQR